MQWGVVSLILFCVNIAAKLVLDLIGVAAGEAFSTAEKSLIFTLGLTLVGEAIVLSMRSGATWPGTARSGAAIAERAATKLTCRRTGPPGATALSAAASNPACSVKSCHIRGHLVYVTSTPAAEALAARSPPSGASSASAPASAVGTETLLPNGPCASHQVKDPSTSQEPG